MRVVRPSVVRRRVLTMLSGVPDGRPAWMTALEEGRDAGLFGPGSAVWAVNGATPTLIAGIRALLIQTLHPGAMAGVHDWSRFREDPLGRLSGTVRWVLTVTYGDTEQAEAACNRVGRIHQRVAGTYVDARDAERTYTANDQDLLSWVHLAFTEAFLGAHLTWGGSIPGGPDAYVNEWARSGELMGVQNPPTSVAELRAQLAGFAAELKPDERVQAAVQFLRNPPLGRGGNIGYRVFFAGAVASLPAEYRRLLGLRRPWWPAITAAGIGLRLVGALLGRDGAGERAARVRIQKLELTDADAVRDAASGPGANTDTDEQDSQAA